MAPKAVALRSCILLSLAVVIALGIPGRSASSLPFGFLLALGDRHE
ncbi:MAG: hypothetical protein KC643_15540 [Nitrospira sp.]|nr:hypothetical protein [Nitrospira sp.]